MIHFSCFACVGISYMKEMCIGTCVTALCSLCNIDRDSFFFACVGTGYMK